MNVKEISVAVKGDLNSLLKLIDALVTLGAIKDEYWNKWVIDMSHEKRYLYLHINYVDFSGNPTITDGIALFRHELLTEDIFTIPKQMDNVMSIVNGFIYLNKLNY